MKIKIVIITLLFVCIGISTSLFAQSVGPDGSFSTSISIDLPPGTNGMDPNLALVYNSNGEEGILGKGWSLSGIPVITRDPSYGINYAGTDHYMGAGGRMQATSEANTYHYEYESFSRIKRYGGTEGNAVYWIEEKPDGTTYYYGGDESGSVESSKCYSERTYNSQNCVRAWLLYKVKDRFGNYYTVEYIQDSGEYYPFRIVYTQRQSGSISKYRTVQFEYESRGNSYPSYLYSTRVETKKRLKGITVKTNVVQIFGIPIDLPFLGRDVVQYQINYKANVPEGEPEIVESIVKYTGISSKTQFEYNSDSRMTKMMLSLGGSYSISYLPAPQITGAVNTSGSSYPRIMNNSPIFLVTKISVDSGVAYGNSTSIYDTEYSYDSSKKWVDIQPLRKSLGFNWIKQKNVQTGEIITTYYEQNLYAAGGMPKKIEKFNGAGVSTYVKEMTFTDDSNSTSAYGTRFVKLVSETETLKEGGTDLFTTVKSYTYDDYGNITRLSAVTSGLPNTETVNTYLIDESAWLLRRLTDTTVNANSVLVSHTAFDYGLNGKGVNATATHNYFTEEGRWISELYEYDDAGNRTRATSPMGYATTIQYDDTYMTFPVKTTNSLGQSVTRTYDEAFGNVLTETDCNNKTTTYEYDSLGRLLKVALSGYSWNVKYAYHDDLIGQVNSQNVEKFTYDGISDDGMFERTYVDGLGRTRRIEETGVPEHDKIQEITYDAAGRKKTETNEYLAGDVPYYTTYSYDASGRVNKIEKEIQDGASKKTLTSTVTFSSSGNCLVAETTDSKGIKTVTYKDAASRPVRKIEASGLPEQSIIEFVYDATGKTVISKLNGSVLTTVQMDSLGRRTSVADANRGTVQYTYYDDGQMKTSTDAKNQTFTYSYDQLGRMTLVRGPAGTPDVTYTYDDPAVANSIGRLTRVTDGTVDTQYAYNDQGEVSYCKQTIDGLTFAFSKTYDALGRLSELTYPDGETIVNHYSEAGQLEAVTPKNSNGTYVRYGAGGSLDPQGSNPIDVTDHRFVRRTGNGIATTVTFDYSTSSPLEVRTEKDGGSCFEDETYLYDNAGNILATTDLADATHNSDRLYQYDGLNRLTKWSKPGGTSEAYEYNASGNLTKKGNTVLRYEGSHPHAVTSTSAGAVYQYDLNGNMTNRNGDTLAFDSRDMLTSMTNVHGTEQYTYDSGGSRIKKALPDGTIVYSVGELYELAIIPGNDPRHTKYIKGTNGDLVAQQTKTGVTLAPAYAVNHIRDGMYSSNDMVRYACMFMNMLNEPLSHRTNTKQRIPVEWFILGCIALLIGLGGRIYYKRSIISYRGLAKNVAPVAISLFIVMSGLSGCSMNGTYDDFLDDENPADITDIEGFPKLGVYFFHPDNVGSVRMISDQEGTIVYRTKYTPYGEKIAADTTGSRSGHYLYTGQEEDATGLLYYNARYYDPLIGRFISADTMVPDAELSQSYNRYMYVMGNPILMNDPLGHFSIGGFGRLIQSFRRNLYNINIFNGLGYRGEGKDPFDQRIHYMASYCKDWFGSRNLWEMIRDSIRMSLYIAAMLVEFDISMSFGQIQQFTQVWAETGGFFHKDFWKYYFYDPPTYSKNEKGETVKETKPWYKHITKNFKVIAVHRISGMINDKKGRNSQMEALLDSSRHGGKPTLGGSHKFGYKTKIEFGKDKEIASYYSETNRNPDEGDLQWFNWRDIYSYW